MMGQVTTGTAEAAAAGEKQGSRSRLEPHGMFFIYLFIIKLRLNHNDDNKPLRVYDTQLDYAYNGKMTKYGDQDES